MPSERQMWEALQPHMVAMRLDPVRVENPAVPGTPDVNYTRGWVELKHADGWPPRGGPLQLKHPPTPQQLVWLHRRYRVGGFCCLLLRVGSEWFAFSPNWARTLWGGFNQPDEQLIRGAAAEMFDGPEEVAQWLAQK